MLINCNSLSKSHIFQYLPEIFVFKINAEGTFQVCFEKTADFGGINLLDVFSLLGLREILLHLLLMIISLCLV